MSPALSVVVPVHDEEPTLPAFLGRILPVLESEDPTFELIFALDPSRDRTLDLLLEARTREPRIKILLFSRRIGQPLATLAGLEHSSGQAVVVMDVDLQDPPEVIPALVKSWRKGFDVVHARRRSRLGETWVKRLVAAAGYRVIRLFSDFDIPADTGDFKLMSRRVVEAIRQQPESHGYLRGMVAVAGFAQTAIEFERDARHSGRGHYGRFFGSVRIGMNGLLGYSNRPLALSGFLGLLALLAAAILGVRSRNGLAALVVFMGGVQLVSVGVLGQYIARIYDEVKRRPRYFVQRKEGF